MNLNLHEQLMRQGVGHDFLVRPGAHNAAYWSASLPCQMLFFQRWFARNAPQPEHAARQHRARRPGGDEPVRFLVADSQHSHHRR